MSRSPNGLQVQNVFQLLQHDDLYFLQVPVVEQMVLPVVFDVALLLNHLMAG